MIGILGFLTGWHTKALGSTISCRQLFSSEAQNEPAKTASKASFLIRAPELKNQSSINLNPKEEFEYLTWRHRGASRPEAIKRDIPRILDLAEQLLREQNVYTQRSQLEADDRSMIPVLVITPLDQPSNSLNQLADQLNRSHFGLKIVYNPQTLLHFSGEAYFSPKHNLLGIPHRMIITGRPDRSFQHELLHAGHHGQRLRGVDSLFFGIAKLLEGPNFAPENPQLYSRYMTLEEINTHASGLLSLAKEIEQSIAISKQRSGSFHEDAAFREAISALDNQILTAHLITLQSIRFLEAALGELRKTSPQLHLSEVNSSPTAPLPSVRYSVLAKIIFEIPVPASARLGQNDSHSAKRRAELEIPLVTPRHRKAYLERDVEGLKRELYHRLDSLLTKVKELHSYYSSAMTIIPKNFADIIEFEQLDATYLSNQLQQLSEHLVNHVETP